MHSICPVHSSTVKSLYKELWYNEFPDIKNSVRNPQWAPILYHYNLLLYKELWYNKFPDIKNWLWWPFGRIWPLVKNSYQIQAAQMYIIMNKEPLTIKKIGQQLNSLTFNSNLVGVRIDSFFPIRFNSIFWASDSIF